MSKKVSKAAALVALHQCLNGPAKAGPKWVTYTRDQVEAMLTVVKELAIAEGAKLRSTENVHDRRA